ncbi:CLUMA_CG019455, isoform A [Clunio marinus]|uniref:Polypeptide N-acetylgalactosaminyltransferase n=1 Tax=Clunio marinus TaxID=568069 RepID=A0A1J1J6K8_9DIPT|nr:CLUMA_CG019455, isoform A [Clunio marinus]
MKRNLITLIKLAFLASVVICLVILFFKSKQQPKDFYRSAKIQQHPKHGSFFSGRPKNVNGKKIDWHDYNLISDEQSRKGLGEQGKAEQLDQSNKTLQDKLFHENGFNALLSDKISLNRSVPDIRHPGCRDKNYLNELPSVSVVVPFYNEHWSTLLRTVYSVINRSPRELLTEIILVDDYSTKEFLKDKLDRFVDANLPKVKVIHLPERGGLITARLTGAKAATGDVLIFLDSHTEANINWLPPLLEPIAEDYKTCVCPFIDVIAYDTFEYRAQDEGARGAFDWKFFYKRLPLRKEDCDHPTEPFPSPVMAGGLFAISTKFFWELGGYDPGLDIWGGEQYELSFKIWQCHGRMVDAPCSRVGHIYRGYAPFSNVRSKDFLSINYKRVAEVWMDEYKDYLYARSPGKYEKIDAGDLTAQKAIREKLQCKPFSWFIKEIAPDLVEKYPPVDPPDFASGAIQSIANPSYCVDTLSHGDKEKIGLYYCANDKKKPHATQFFALSWQRDIRIKHGESCWDVSESGEAPILLFGCHGMQGNQLWKYDQKMKHIIHLHSSRCLQGDFDEKKVFVSKCKRDEKNQKWNFGFVNTTALDDWENSGSRII